MTLSDHDSNGKEIAQFFGIRIFFGMALMSLSSCLIVPIPMGTKEVEGNPVTNSEYSKNLEEGISRKEVIEALGEPSWTAFSNQIVAYEGRIDFGQYFWLVAVGKGDMGVDDWKVDRLVLLHFDSADQLNSFRKIKVDRDHLKRDVTIFDFAEELGLLQSAQYDELNSYLGTVWRMKSWRSANGQSAYFYKQTDSPRNQRGPFLRLMEGVFVRFDASGAYQSRRVMKNVALDDLDYRANPIPVGLDRKMLQKGRSKEDILETFDEPSWEGMGGRVVGYHGFFDKAEGFVTPERSNPFFLDILLFDEADRLLDIESVKLPKLRRSAIYSDSVGVTDYFEYLMLNSTLKLLQRNGALGMATFDALTGLYPLNNSPHQSKDGSIALMGPWNEGLKHVGLFLAYEEGELSRYETRVIPMSVFKKFEKVAEKAIADFKATL